MSQSVNLREGFVSSLLNGTKPNDNEAVNVQVYNIQNKNEKIVFMVSDGKQCMYGLFSNELAEQYKENKLPIKEHSIIKLLNYNATNSKGRTICYISQFDTIAHANGKIGNPINASNPNNNNNLNKTSSKKELEYQPISSLNPYQPSWRIKVRVTQKSAMRRYNKNGKESVVFSINLLDSEGTEIQATMFNEACKKFYPIIEEQSIYYISNARVTISRQRYTHIKNDYQIIINENSNVILASSGSSDNNDEINTQVYKFTKINDIINCDAGSFVDICAIVSNVNDIAPIISKKTGQTLEKRTISLCDDSCKLIDLTLWGNMAQEYNKQKLSNNEVIVIKAARVSEYSNTKQLACNNILINPFDSVNESQLLQTWWKNGGNNETFEQLIMDASMMNGKLNGTLNATPRYSVEQIKNIDPFDINNTDNKSLYFSLIGTITRTFEINDNNRNSDSLRLPWYKACTDPNANNAKVTQESDGSYHCVKTGKTYQSYNARYVTRFGVEDNSGQIWLNAFNDAATMILQTECKTVENYYNNGNFSNVNKVFKNALFRRYVFRIRAKSQEYNGQQRVRYDLVTVQPVNFVKEAQTLMDAIENIRKLQATF